MLDVDYGYGVIIDIYETDNFIPYYQVAWPGAEQTWWRDIELELVSESK